MHRAAIRIARRRLLPVAIVLAIAYGGLVLLAWQFAGSAVFQPEFASGTYPPSQAPIELTTADGVQLVARYQHPPQATHALLFSHGNAENLGELLPLLERFQAAGFATLAYDYRGYGQSEGAPSEAGIYADIEAAYNYLRQYKGIPAERIVLHGRSLGAAAAIDLAARKPVSGLIAESAFTSLFRVVLPPILPFDKFRNLAKIRHIQAPVAVWHGCQDSIVPVQHGRQLFAAASEPKRHWWVAGAGHTDLVPVAGDGYVERLRAFRRWVQSPEREPRASPAPGEGTGCQRE